MSETQLNPTAPDDASAFKKRAQGTTLELPSGLKMICRRVELKTFIRQGNVPNALLGIIDEALQKGQDMDVEEMVKGKDHALNMDMITDMYDTVDLVVSTIAISPPVHRVPTDDDLKKWNLKNPTDIKHGPEELRDDSLLYTDEIDDEDKMFLFQWSSGGTADLATFREEALSTLDAVAKIKNG